MPLRRAAREGRPGSRSGTGHCGRCCDADSLSTVWMAPQMCSPQPYAPRKSTLTPQALTPCSSAKCPAVGEHMLCAPPVNNCPSLSFHEAAPGWVFSSPALGGLTCEVAMLIPPLARAACRPQLHHHLHPQHAYLSARVFTSSPLHRKDAHGQRTAAARGTLPPGSKDAAQQTKAPLPAKPNTLLAEQTVTNKEQRKADWAIIKEMSHYLWPKDNLGTRFRVGLSVALLVGAKLLNVQVPFYFKNIVDSMNIDFATMGGTAATVAGSMIVACKTTPKSSCPSD